ncbi:MAG: FKBP-type peptidyl-prolyl cis-trans isomerase [Paramuribaculum sp.]|nr:FKBP-type peptidyl-prolyl cis-trans isomerase [Paramuribaculum sp.]
MFKRLILLVAVVLSVGKVHAAAPLTTWESDSVSAALAGVWSEYFVKRGAVGDDSSKNAYLAGLKAALAAADSSAAYSSGLESGVLVNSRLQQIEKMGQMKIDRTKFVEEIDKILSGAPAQYTAANGNEYMEQMMYRRSYRGDEVLMSEAMMDSVAGISGIVKTPNGVYVQTLTEGNGNFPKADSSVKLMYTGKLPGGKIFDGTRDMPETMSLTRVIPGFREGLMHMKPGGTYRMWIPSNLAYGSIGVPGTIPGNCALQFDVDFRAFFNE